MESLFCAIVWALMIQVLVLFIALAVTSALVIAWILSPRMRVLLYQLTITPKQRKYDRALSQLEITPQQLSAITCKPVAFDVIIDPRERSHGTVAQSAVA